MSSALWQPELEILVKATLAIALGLAAARAAGRARAALRHALLASAFVALLALPFASMLVPPVAISVPVARAVGAAANTVVTGDAREPAQQNASGASSRWRWAALLRTAWAAGMTLGMAWLGLSLLRLDRLRRGSLPWLERRALLGELGAAAGVRRKLEIALHEDVPAPLTFGLRRPMIVLPAEAASWSDADVRRALLHEVEHVRRDDWAVQVAARVACAVYWFQPLVELAWRQLRLEAERACDDAVLREAEPADYAEQLVLLARRLSGASLQGGLTMVNRSDLSTRVTALLDGSQARGRAGRLALFATWAAAAGIVLALAPLRAVGATGEGGRPSWRERGLLQAAERGDLDQMRELLDFGAKVDVAVEGDGSPLIAAARQGRLEAVRLLLDRGADPDMAVAGDGAPLIMAAREGQLRVVELLLDRGASVDLVVPEDENALIQASGGGHLRVVKLLVARGADVNARAWAESARERRGGEWRTPLGMARRGGHRPVVDFLLSAGAHE